MPELFIGKKEIDEDLLDELETQLLVSDVGVEATTEIIETLSRKVKYKELDDADALMAALQAELAGILEPADQPLVIQNKIHILLFWSWVLMVLEKPPLLASWRANFSLRAVR